jgi:hypothetical protein
MPPTKPAPRLCIDSCEALFSKLKWDYEQLAKDWSSYCTFNFALTAYHLYQDWIKRAGTEVQKSRKSALPDQGRLLFDVWRDVTNATKHWELNERSQSQQVVSSVSNPQVADWYAYLITGPVIYIEVGDARPSLTQLADVTLWCFKWILEGEESFAYADLCRQLELAFRPIQSNPI